jgi:hypothetical protein
MNLFEKMSAITNELGTIPKNLTIGTGKWQYKAVGENDVLNAVKKLEEKHKVFSYPFDRRTVTESYQLAAKDDGEDGKSKVFIRIETTYRFVDIENPESYIDVKAYGDGIDTLDKAPGKAITYADKYCLLKAYKIETGDDLDRKPSDDLAGHDIAAIKQRVEQIITSKIQKGMDLKDVYARIGINEKQFDSLMSYYSKLDGLEKALQKL